MLRKACLKLDLLSKHCITPLESSVQAKEAFNIVAQKTLSFLSNIVAFMRCEAWYEASSMLFSV